MVFPIFIVFLPSFCRIKRSSVRILRGTMLFQKFLQKGLTVHLVYTLHFKGNDDRIAGGHDMTIKEVEEQTGLTRSNIRFYEREKLIEPTRNDKNGYRDYSEQVEKYVADLETYWNDNKPVFRLDSVSFLYLWGSLVTWTVVTSLCLLVGILSYTNLPPKILVQWDHGIAVSFVNRIFIFLFPAACIIIRIWLRPIIYVKWLMNYPYGELVREYLSNYMCFAVLSSELFMILFVHGILKSIVAVLLADTVVLIGLLIIGIKNR